LYLAHLTQGRTCALFKYPVQKTIPDSPVDNVTGYGLPEVKKELVIGEVPVVSVEIHDLDEDIPAEGMTKPGAYGSPASVDVGSDEKSDEREREGVSVNRIEYVDPFVA